MKRKIIDHTEKAILAPSILSADFSCLADEIKEVESAGVQWLHIDAMDGKFVPNLTIGPLVVDALRPITSLVLDCHLMVERPEDLIEPFAKAGADFITIHAETTKHANRHLNRIRELGCGAGIAVNPATPLNLLDDILDLVDLVLIMSVNPGFGGQKFIERSISKIETLKRLRGERKFLIEVDGGVSAHNIGKLHRAGADVFVAGSAVFSAPDRKKSVMALKNILEK